MPPVDVFDILGQIVEEGNMLTNRPELSPLIRSLNVPIELT